MPRLLLVDDNPSIHKIAETLLSTTAIELVCVESGDQALRRVLDGEHFDVALVDTAMIGMDGWTLLARLREIPATARIPIAMMAGVLDSVDPGRLESAPIQGFLKKPVELRELGDRIEKLLAQPVPEPPAPQDAGTATLHLPVPAEDVLLLEADDLWEEAPVTVPAAPPAVPLPEEESLELEELDFESLREIPQEPTSAPSVLEELLSREVPAPQEATPPPSGNPWSQEAWEKTPVAPLPAEDEDQRIDTGSLPDLGELLEAAESPTLSLETPAPEAPAAPVAEFEGGLDLTLEDELDLFPAAEPAQAGEGHAAALALGALGLAAVAGTAAIALHESPAPEPPAVPPTPAAAPPVTLAAPAPEPSPEPAPGPAAVAVPTHPLVEAILQDPAALEALARALAARLGDKVLREVAWEVMPELADRLKR